MIEIDEKSAILKLKNANGEEEIIPFSSPKAFALISKYWLRIGWDTKHVYTFSWLGRPIIQLPEDVLRIQEVIYRVKPDIIIETGVAHGGSIVFYASILKAMGLQGKVIGVDIEIRPHNRQALEAHELKPYFELIEGSSIDVKVVEKVASFIKPNSKVLVLLDSNHTKEHVLNELYLYSEFVTKDSYIVATDGIMKDLSDAPRSNPDWKENNPFTAVQEFLQKKSEFVLEQPAWLFNESLGLNENITYWPGAYLKRI
ncbi:MAG: cephalosporin hydroxylase family protein [Gammaproteobacteria bacterium]|nr:cephalosporin hydroxylase family protein [Gammaproteobacteria bacterium]